MTTIKPNWLYDPPDTIATPNGVPFKWIRDTDRWSAREPSCNYGNDDDGGHMWQEHGTRFARNTYFGKLTNLEIIWYMCISCHRLRIDVRHHVGKASKDADLIRTFAHFYTVGPLP